MGALGQLLLSAGRLSLPGWGPCCGVVLVAGVWEDGSCWYSRARRLLSTVESALGIFTVRLLPADGQVGK